MRCAIERGVHVLMRVVTPLRGAILAGLVVVSVVPKAEAKDLFRVVAADVSAKVDNQTLDKIRRRATASSINLLNIDVSALNTPTTTMALQSGKVRRAFVGERSDVTDGKSFTWTGRLDNIPGRATLVVNKGQITGVVHDGGDLYRIEPVTGTTHALVKVDQSKFPADHPESFDLRAAKLAIPPVNVPPVNVGPTQINVMVAYTPAAKAAVADIAATITLAVAEANQSYINSGVNIRLNLVTTTQFNYVEAGKSYDEILGAFGSSDAIRAQRNQSQADMFAVIVNQPQYCGMADTILANAYTAFAAVHFDCATGYYSFAHELGHLQGARHNPTQDPTAGFNHGYQYTASQPFWRTIMAYQCAAGNCPRLQYWSNPGVSYNGNPMGDAQCCDNTRELNMTAPVIAGFRNTYLPTSAQDIVFIKTANTASGRVEVQVTTGDSNYLTRTISGPTTFANENDGVWQLLRNRDLAFIKTANTPSGNVEVHIASAASNYQQRILEVPTTFANENDGVWQLLGNGDLAFIKTANTPNGHAEVHIASAASNYQQRILEIPTVFPNDSKGVWQMAATGDLAYIKNALTSGGTVEVHLALAATNYQVEATNLRSFIRGETDGTWQLAIK